MLLKIIGQYEPFGGVEISESLDLLVLLGAGLAGMDITVLVPTGVLALMEGATV